MIRITIEKIENGKPVNQVCVLNISDNDVGTKELGDYKVRHSATSVTDKDNQRHLLSLSLNLAAR